MKHAPTEPLQATSAALARSGSGDALAPAWDSYLQQTILGQFQQSSGWARVKAQEGWSVQRVYVHPTDVTVGGAQILWKRSRFGRIGYVSKGPVLPNESPAAIDEALLSLKRGAATLGLRALVVQPPDESRISAEDLVRRDFEPAALSSVIRATAVIDVSDGRDAFMGRMNRQARREGRLAVKAGVSVRLGERSDLPAFFRLMVESSRRQGSEPNPSRLELLEALWDAFASHALLGLAEHGSRIVAGLLMIGHGRRLTFWKKGWNAEDHHLHANCLLNIEALGWALDRSYSTVDFVGLAPATAEALLAGQELTEEQRRSRDIFNLRLGAQPRLLPAAHLLIVNPLWRRIYRLACRFPVARQAIGRRLG